MVVGLPCTGSSSSVRRRGVSVLLPDMYYHLDCFCHITKKGQFLSKRLRETRASGSTSDSRDLLRNLLIRVQSRCTPGASMSANGV